MHAHLYLWISTTITTQFCVSHLLLCSRISMSHPSDRARIAQDTDFPPQALHKRHPNEVAAAGRCAEPPASKTRRIRSEWCQDDHQSINTAGVIYDKEGAQKARSELQDWELAQAKAAAATGRMSLLPLVQNVRRWGATKPSVPSCYTHTPNLGG
eukprot:1159825-Pelagomonas_calceolata.AAC.8